MRKLIMTKVHDPRLLPNPLTFPNPGQPSGHGQHGTCTRGGDFLHRAPERGALVGGTHRALKRTRAQRRADKRDFCSREPEIAPPSPLTHPSTELPIVIRVLASLQSKRTRSKAGAKKKRDSTTFRDTRCGHGPCTKNGADSMVDNFNRSKSWKSLHRGGRVKVDAGRIESFEGAPARNHGPGDQRGVIVDADDDDADDDDDLEL